MHLCRYTGVAAQLSGFQVVDNLSKHLKGLAVLLSAIPMSISLPKVLLIAFFFVSPIAAHYLDILTPLDGQTLVAGSTVSTTWNASTNPSGHTFAILLQQGNKSVTGQVSAKISTIVFSSVPNSGSYAWILDPTLPSGNDYYIRLQTGTANDWDGGVGGIDSAPSQEDVFGLSGYFNVVPAIQSPSPSHNQTSSATVFAPSSDVSTIPPVSHSKKGTNLGVIIGSTLGSLAALALLALLIILLAWLASRNTPPVPGSNPGKTRNFAFLPFLPSRSGNEKMEPVQITLTLTPTARPEDRKYDTVAWQVFNFDNSKKEYPATLPHDLGFGVVSREEGRDAITPISMISSSIFDFAPPGWPLSMRNQGGIISFEKASKRDPNAVKRILVKNECMGARQIAVGSYHVNKDEEAGGEPRFQPFLVVGDVPHDDEFYAQADLILHAYQTREITVGEVITQDMIKESRPLLGEKGLKISKLSKVTTWRVEEEEPGKVKLVLEKQQKLRRCC